MILMEKKDISMKRLTSALALLSVLSLPVSAWCFNISDFFLVISNNISLSGSTFSIIEIKRPDPTYRYTKVQVVPINGTISRVIPIKIDRALQKGGYIIFDLLKIVGGEIGNQIIKRGVLGFDIFSIFSDISDFLDENLDKAALEFDMSNLDVSGTGNLYFFVELSDNSASLSGGACYSRTQDQTLACVFDFSSWPYSFAPF